MYVPPLLPDELLRGYRGRLRVVNNISRSDAVAQAFNIGTTRDASCGRHKLGFAEVAAQANGLELKYVLSQHTLIPFNKALEWATVADQIEQFAQSVRGRIEVSRYARQQAWFCMECVKEDLDFWHTSYWRRSHQLPGLLWCDKHLSTLRRVGLGAVDDGPPDHQLELSTEPDPEWVVALQNNSTIKTFVELGSELLTSGLTLSLKLQVDRIGNRLAERGACWSRSEVGFLLANEARRQVPPEWFHEVFPRNKWTSSGAIPVIDNVIANSKTTTTSALLLAVVLAHGTFERVLAELRAPHVDHCPAS